MKQIGVGIIGLGIVGERLINVFNRHPRIEIVSGYDIDRDRMDHISEKYNIKTTKAWEEIIADKDVEMVYIAVPPKYHHEIAMKVIEAGKTIFCEKPLANSIDEALEMYKAVENSDLINGINFPLYYFSGYEKIKEILGNNEIGTIKRVELTGIFPSWPREWQQNNWIDTKDQGGFTREVFTHFIQVIHSLFGEITNINSSVTYPKDINKSETSLIATGRANGGIPILFNGLTGVDQREELTLKIYGTGGVLELANWRDLWFKNEKDGRLEIERKPIDPTYSLVDSFVKAIDGKGNNLVKFKDGYLAAKVVETLLSE